MRFAYPLPLCEAPSKSISGSVSHSIPIPNWTAPFVVFMRGIVGVALPKP